MGAIAEAMVDYAKPLLDASDGSIEQMNTALTLAQICWNLALQPDKEIENGIELMRPNLNMDDDEFEEFRCSVILPMIRRQHQMFPNMSKFGSKDYSKEASPPQRRLETTLRTEKYPGTGRNEPCPCNSGRKYKRCCGQ
jgi:hypothetical protein